MTYQEYTQLLSQLPEDLRKEYGFNEPFDYSPYKCIHTDEYDYYPELNCCIIDNVPIAWEKTANQYINLKNPEHLTELKRRVANKIIIKDYIVSIGTNKDIYCQGQRKDEYLEKFIRKQNMVCINYHGITMYYNPNKLDLTTDKTTRLLAWCLIMGQKYNTIGIEPNPNESPSEWAAIGL